MSTNCRSAFMKIPKLKKNYARLTDCSPPKIKSSYWVIDKVVQPADYGFKFYKYAPGALPINSYSGMIKYSIY